MKMAAIRRKGRKKILRLLCLFAAILTRRASSFVDVTNLWCA
jgi:hypothetical protein